MPANVAIEPTTVCTDIDTHRGEYMGDGIARTANGTPYDPETGNVGKGSITLTSGQRTFRLVSPADIKTTRLRFLWYPWLRPGLNVIAGEGGSRKSTFSAYVCAQATRGLLADQDGNRNKPGHVLYIAQGEDDTASVLAPRLLAQGCDPQYTHILQVSVLGTFGTETTATVGREDLDAIKTICAELRPVLIVFDPLALLVPGDINSYQDVQPALVACNELAEIAGGGSVLGIHHWNRNGSFTGSQKFQDTSRSFMEIAVDPDYRTTSIVSLTKANNAPKSSLRITADLVPYECSDGTTTTVQIIRATAPSKLSVEDLRQSRVNGEDADDMNDIDRWLVRYLKTNENRAVYGDIINAGRKSGYSRDQLKRAKRRLHITSTKGKFQGATYWQLPPEDTQ
ncbi:AAA family ATPase [Bifidobacterium saguinibicoloris]|uniref:AAA family ATPase n=1 Tax=Bifidobacterium saguinibicoloris TaxID=2834433 RepID=UPI001C5651A0|nr:AAA family ATPase [Bifidobacterium saguinibicoloris]MBW3080671.1 AAA family ATPase [Bifidobacterium saguinibicoloris]